MVIIDYFWLLSLYSTDDKEMVGDDCCRFTRERRVSYIESQPYWKQIIIFLKNMLAWKYKKSSLRDARLNKSSYFGKRDKGYKMKMFEPQCGFFACLDY